VVRLKIASYNVRYFGHATRGLASTRSGMRKIAEALASIDPVIDVLCLQEVEAVSWRSDMAGTSSGDDASQLARFASDLHVALVRRGKDERYRAFYFPAHEYVVRKKPLYTTGLAILVREGLHVSVHNTDDPHDITHRRVEALAGVKQTRVCAHVRIRTGEGPDVDVFNTHLSLPSTFAPEFWTEPRRLGWGKNQLEEARRLVDFVHAAKGGDAWVVAGDFNALPGSPVYRYLTQERGMQDAFGLFTGRTVEALRDFPTAGFMSMRMHLDHVFASRAVQWLEFDATAAFGDDRSVFHKLSDHVPVIGSCRFSGRGT
jgi:endonuclease/exonuclease/phosphatase family metal-dependent hydrolase